MDSYGVIEVGDHLLSIPGLAFYLITVLALVMVSWGLSASYWLWKYRMSTFLGLVLPSIAIWTWGLMEFGMWFYVEA
jgi:hypothetical protein